MSTNVSEELTNEIDQAVEEVFVTSEGSEEEISVPSSEENLEETKTTPKDTQEITGGDTQQGTQEDIQGSDPSEDTLEDSEEDTPKDTPKEDAASQLSPQQPSFQRESLVRAMSNGLTLSEARSFGSDEELNYFSGRLELNARSVESKQNQKEQEVVDPFADLPKLDPESFDPEVVEMFDKLVGIVKDQHTTIQDYSTQQEQFQNQYFETSQVANQTEVETWFDSQVENLGDNFKDVLGEGKYNALDKGSPHFKNRDAIANQMSVLLAGYNAQGFPIPPREEVFGMATRSVLSEKFSELKNNELSDKLKEQSKQHIQRANKSSSAVVKTPEEVDAEIAASIDEQFFGK